MTIQIGDRTFSIRTPKDLDDQLIAATGCNAAEHAAMLGGTPLASQLAKALHPFLAEDAPSVPELAMMIAEAGYEALVQPVRDLFRKVEGAAVFDPRPSPGETRDGE